MNLRLENLFLFLAVMTDLIRTVSSFDSRCPPLKLVNGRTRYLWRGRSVRFNCRPGFQLVGVKYGTCMNGKWDIEVPICVRTGCRAPSTNHVNGQFIESYRGAVVKIICNPGYVLMGSPSVYCDGNRWNETFPVCRVANLNPALSCDFEPPDQCGWSQDPMHDFDWKLRNESTPSIEDRYRNTTELAKGGNSTGYYMYISYSLRTENDTSRLYSPVYKAELSQGHCFKFKYRMIGSAGTLKVYVKPEGVELFDVIPSFWSSGEERKSWTESFIPIESIERPFQIVIEGVRGSASFGIIGETSIDDVRLTSAENCKILEEVTSSTEFSSSVNPEEDSLDLLSCKNRCGQDKINAAAPAGPEDATCTCYESCDRDGSCCSDYFDVCSPFASTQSTTTQTDKSSSSSSSLSTATSTVEPELELPPPRPPHLHHNISNEIQNKSYGKPPSDRKTEKTPVANPPWRQEKKNNEVEQRKPSERLPPKNALDRASNEIPRIVPTKSTARPKTTTEKTTTPKTERKPAKAQNETDAGAKAIEPKVTGGKAEKTEENKTKPGNEPKAEEPKPKVEEKPETGNNTFVTSSVSTTTTRVFRNPKPNNIQFQKTFLEKPSSTNLSNEFRFIKGNQKEVSGKEPPQAIKIDKSEEKDAGVLRGILEMGSATIAVLVIIILGVVFYKRRENRKAERESMVEDSDSILYKMDSTLSGTESDSLVCIRPGTLEHSV